MSTSQRPPCARLAAELAAARRLAERARADAMWADHDSQACWYAGRLKAARGLESQAARARAAAAEAEAHAAELAAEIARHTPGHAWPRVAAVGGGL